MAIGGLKVMDSDMHVQEPPDLWQRYMSEEFRDRAPIGTTHYLTDLHLEHDGEIISRSKKIVNEEDLARGLAKKYGRLDLFEDYDRRGWGPDVQIEAMDAEGIDVAVLFPTRGLFAHAKEYDDDNLAADISRAYNDWLADFCGHAPERMYGAAMLPAQNVPACVEEIRRAGARGFKAVFLRPNPIRKRNWNNPVYDPMWAECANQGLTVGFHEGTPCALPVAMGDRFDGVHEDLWLTEHTAAHPIEAMYACLSIVAGGVCERFPRLRFAFLEGNASWLPFWLWRMDEHWEARRHLVEKQLPMPPSEYFKRQCFVGVEADEALARYAIEEMGDDYFVFSTDFPHQDCRYPNATRTLTEQPFSAQAKRKILWDNCARLYDF